MSTTVQPGSQGSVSPTVSRLWEIVEHDWPITTAPSQWTTPNGHFTGKWGIVYGDNVGQDRTADLSMPTGNAHLMSNTFSQLGFSPDVFQRFSTASYDGVLGHATSPDYDVDWPYTSIDDSFTISITAK